MQFIDYAKIFAASGNGGKGCVSFRREKYVPRGGPDGGDGGKGGDIIIKASIQINTLLDFKYKREYHAKNGQNGMGKKMHGENSDDLVIPVPAGTVIKNADSDEVIADLIEDGAYFIAAKGGRGGLGNAHFATPTRQVPMYAQPGEKGEEKWLILELKLLADVGLIGFPNAGKSTLISVISSARPKIADYPFTTLIPNLGVVKLKEHRSCVVADIPGLIEGAHRGAGLGARFLRHIERTRIFLHLVDVSDMADEDPVAQYLKIRKELGIYSHDLLLKPETVVATKIDSITDKTRLDMLEKYCKTNAIDFIKISSVTGKGIRTLLNYLSKALERK
ncbi:MAG: GTPase ObgE [Nitrospira bacterium HGW-Nitrospira-1]|nr:MAG: GTPase ObgE [Nitrospira bacterium HGW-Nitrospira-1]